MVGCKPSHDLRGQRARGLAELAPYQATDTIPDVLIVVVGRIQDGRVQVQAVRAVITVRRPTPIVAARTTKVRGRAIEEAGVEEIVREASKTVTHNVTGASAALAATSSAIPLGKSAEVFGGSTASG